MAVIEDVQQFMTIGADPSQTKSFEEVRFDEYLKAYMTTGGPPQPCPELPTSDVARTALNLPPLFKPYTASPPGSGSSSSTTSSQPAATCLNPEDLPVGQDFKITKVDGESYESIIAAAQYAFFSPEELRYYTYLRGQKMPPLTVTMAPFSVTASSTAGPSQTPTTTGPLSGDTRETLQSIISQPLFDGHSFEELRVVYLLAGKELNSAEIRQFLNPATAAVVVPAAPGAVGPPATPGPPILGPTTSPQLFGVPQPGTSPFALAPQNSLFGVQLGPPLSTQPGPAFSFKFGA